MKKFLPLLLVLILIGLAVLLLRDPDERPTTPDPAGGSTEAPAATDQPDDPASAPPRLGERDPDAPTGAARLGPGPIADRELEQLILEENTVDGLLLLLERGRDMKISRRTALRRLAELDPAAAAAWLDEQPTGTQRDAEVPQVADAWLAQDLDAATEWFMEQELPDADAEAHRLARIVNYYRSEDPDGAGRWLETQPDAPVRDMAETMMAFEHADRRDWPAAMEWLTGVEDESMRRDALGDILRGGWDSQNETLPADLVEAAEAAGFEESVSSFEP